MSQFSNLTTPQIENNDEVESINDLFKRFTEMTPVIKTFSNSSESNLKNEAKKLEKKLGLQHKDALDEVARKKGFKSFNDFRKQFLHWQNLPTVFIYIANNQANTSVISFDDHRLGIKLLTEEEKAQFFNSQNNRSAIKFGRMSRDSGYLYKFIHFKLDPNMQDKLRNELEESSKKYQYRFLEADFKTKVTEHIDAHFRAYLVAEKYAEIYPDAYIVNGEYYNAVGLHDDFYDEFGPLSDSNY